MKNFLKSTVLILTISLGLILQSCNKNNDPGLSNVKMGMKATTVLSTINPGGRVAATGLVFTEVLLGVTEIEFETLEENKAEDNGDFEDKDGDGEDDNEDVEYEGNYIVDLIAGTSTPDFGVADIAPGLYEEIEIEMAPILDGGITMFVAFDHTPDGGSTISYEYSTNMKMELEIENENGFLLDEGALNNLLVVIDLDALFNSVDLNSATADSDGVVRINENSNTALAAQIANNFNNAIEGGEDEDDDGELDG
jgi:hypothetical protein